MACSEVAVRISNQVVIREGWDLFDASAAELKAAVITERVASQEKEDWLAAKATQHPCPPGENCLRRPQLPVSTVLQHSHV